MNLVSLDINGLLALIKTVPLEKITFNSVWLAIRLVLLTSSENTLRFTCTISILSDLPSDE